MSKYEGKNLRELRECIDAIDKQMVELFRERMSLSAEIAKVKKEKGLPILDINREKAKLDRIAKDVEDEMSGFTSKLYLTLADLSKSYQSKLFGIELDDFDISEDDE